MSEKLLHQRRAVRSNRVKRGFPAYNIVRIKFGGMMNFCAATGFSPSQVQRWLYSGLIPAKWLAPGLSYYMHIIESGAAIGIEISESDFVEIKT